MISFALSNWRLILMGLLLTALVVQELRIRWVKAEFQTYRAEIERQVAENRVRNAQEQARQAHNAKESLDALQGRYAALESRYKRLRDSSSPARVPTLAESAGVAQACPGSDGKPNPVIGRLERIEGGVEEILKLGDRELAKYVELWKLQEKNSGR